MLNADGIKYMIECLRSGKITIKKAQAVQLYKVIEAKFGLTAALKHPTEENIIKSLASLDLGQCTGTRFHEFYIDPSEEHDFLRVVDVIKSKIQDWSLHELGYLGSYLSHFDSVAAYASKLPLLSSHPAIVGIRKAIAKRLHSTIPSKEDFNYCRTTKHIKYSAVDYCVSYGFTHVIETIADNTIITWDYVIENKKIAYNEFKNLSTMLLNHIIDGRI